MLRFTFLIGAILTLAACADPLDGLDRISDVDLANEDPAARALPTDAEIAREGFFGTGAAAGGEGAVVPADETAEDRGTPERRGGFLGLFRRGASDAPSEEDTAQAALAPETEPEPERNGGGGLFGLFGGGDAPRGGTDTREVAYGTVLPYGVIARVCDAKGNPLGPRIENAPARGYALHDSAPGSAVARTFYVTGFSDGCPRQFTAANVLLGAPSLYEQLHYGPGGENLPVGATDRAYEEVKRDVCGAGQGKPCGSRIGRMDRTTFFVSAYDSFGNSSRWTEFLIHDGDVIASAIKTSG
ncbi:hypothetical protein BOO69_13945 [Sulfitobacter alexandrii]|uniref:Uncharacterized protein n=1 Tax=Sulfitobacter alexandrii TaxID=1917485 RepID=A0A1J0WJ90_9RHOB|nr:hypothetical protein [Sulfitobacter alexandrii]APE44385.1 hypothetical protein BOO69_13945 [Sulfitobacter alexandrii]